MNFPKRATLLAVAIAVLTMPLSAVLGARPPANQTQQEATPGQTEPFTQAEPSPESGLTAAAPVDPSSYKIGPEDHLAVQVWREPEVSARVIVRPDGMITLPLIGDVMAGGKTPEELSKVVGERLSEFLHRPEVMISVVQVRSKRYYISGQVNRTGPFPLVVPTTVLQALSSAGGFQLWAKTKKIVIIRGNERLKFNYNDVVKGKNLSQNVYLENGDP